MKGVIFNIVEEVVVNAHGAETWEVLLDHAGLDGAYTSLGGYDDAELTRLVAAGSAATGMTEAELLRWIGRQAIPLMAIRWPGFFSAHASVAPFLRSLNSVIHPEVHKLYAGAQCPHFDVSVAADGALLMGYRSARRLCQLAHGFIHGAADHYGQTVALRHLKCMHQGDDKCVIAVGAG